MDLSDAIKGILHYREQIHKEHLWSDPIKLSEAMVKLSVYNSYLADNIAPLHKQATDKAYSVFMEASATEGVTKAETLSRGESTAQRQEYENVKNIYSSTANLISVIQSRIRVLENQLKQEGV